MAWITQMTPLINPLDKMTFNKFRDLIGLEQENYTKDILEPKDAGFK